MVEAERATSRLENARFANAMLYNAIAKSILSPQADQGISTASWILAMIVDYTHLRGGADALF